MSRDITIMIFAIFRQESDQVEQINPRIRVISHDLEITTETDVIKMNVEAEIATADEFRNLFRGNLEAGKSKNVRILSVRPGSTREVLTKPTKLANNNNNDFDIQEIEEKEFLEANKKNLIQ